MLKGFQLHTDKDEYGNKTITNKKVWVDQSFLQTKSDIGLLKSTMVYCDSMTPAERSNDEMAKYLLGHLKEKIESKGFVVFAIYRFYIIGKDNALEIQNPIQFFVECWHPEGKEIVGSVPSANKY